MHREYFSVGDWVWILIFPIIGGFVSFYLRVKNGHARMFNLVELVGELFTSGFVGVLVFIFFSHHGFDSSDSAIASGMSGHFATRLLFLAEKILDEVAIKIQERLSCKIDKFLQ